MRVREDICQDVAREKVVDLVEPDHADRYERKRRVVRPGRAEMYPQRNRADDVDGSRIEDVIQPSVTRWTTASIRA